MRFIQILLLMLVVSSAQASEITLPSDNSWVKVLDTVESGMFRARSSKGFRFAQSTNTPSSACFYGFIDKTPYFTNSGHNNIWACSTSGEVKLIINKSTDARF